MATHRYSDGYRSFREADPARQVAFEVLTLVRNEDAYANLVLPKVLKSFEGHTHLDQRDRAFAVELTYGTLREQGFLDWVISRNSSRPLSDIEGGIIDILRLGVYQLLRMRVPDHAAVSQTVDLARQYLSAGPAKFINAVLRSVIREGEETRQEALNELPDSQRLAIEYSHPQWMVEEYSRALVANGCSSEEIAELLAANNQAPYVSLVARPSLIEVDELADQCLDYLQTRIADGEVSPYAVLLESGDPARIPAIRQRRAAVQDEGSQLAGILAAQVPVVGKDQNWLDLCAGPGGKAALVASLGVERGAQLIANEVHSHRARLVEKTLEHLDNTEVVCSDGTRFGGEGTRWALESFDRVIIDAPCSGLGSMRRRPESRWRRDQNDVSQLVSLQAELLDRGIELTRPGGVTVYITCSPVVQETLDQISRVLSAGRVELVDLHPVASQITPRPLNLPQAEGIAARTIQLWEHRNETDLMFIAALRKLPVAQELS